jgi:hypothetical protein
MEELLSNYITFFDRLSADVMRLDTGDSLEVEYCREQKEELTRLNARLIPYPGFRELIEIVQYAATFLEPTVISFNNLLDKIDLIIKKINDQLASLIYHYETKGL